MLFQFYFILSKSIKLRANQNSVWAESHGKCTAPESNRKTMDKAT